jgi:hypothetical protein
VPGCIQAGCDPDDLLLLPEPLLQVPGCIQVGCDPFDLLLLPEPLLQVPGCIQVSCDPVDLLLLLPQDLEVLLTHPPHLHFLLHNKDKNN